MQQVTLSMEEVDMTAIAAIRKFFGEGPGGRVVTLPEIKACSAEERRELGKLAAEALGEVFEETKGP